MKITTTTTTIELDTSAAVAYAATLERETGLSVDGESLEDVHECSQCSGPLEADRISPTGEHALDDPMCEDCELEYVNPPEWYRRHPETPRFGAVKGEGDGWHIADYAHDGRLLKRKGHGTPPPARLSEERARKAVAQLRAKHQK
jgi:hypothetical protein